MGYYECNKSLHLNLLDKSAFNVIVLYSMWDQTFKQDHSHFFGPNQNVLYMHNKVYANKI